MCSNINTCPFSICKPPFQGTHPTRVIFSLSVQPPSVYMTCHCMRPVSAGSHNQTNHLEGHMHANPFSRFQASLRETHIHSQSCSYISPPTPRDTFKNFPTQYLQCYGRQPFGGFSPGGMTLWAEKKGCFLPLLRLMYPFSHSFINKRELHFNDAWERLRWIMLPCLKTKFPALFNIALQCSHPEFASRWDYTEVLRKRQTCSLSSYWKPYWKPDEENVHY